MSNFLKSHLEKIFLFLILSIFTFLALIIKEESKVHENNNSTSFSVLSSKKINNQKYYAVNTSSSLMPGDFLYYELVDEKETFNTEVLSIYYYRNTKLKIFHKGGVVSGTLRKSFTIDKNWSESRELVNLKTSSETVAVQVSDISLIFGESSIQVEDENLPVSETNILWSTYQRTFDVTADYSISEKPKWTLQRPDRNSSDYDLFTPPVIYIHEGKLTTRVPSVKEEKEDLEPFGLKLISANKTPYPLLLVGWVSSIPYFQLLENESAELPEKIVRNRVIPNTYYKRKLNPKPGQPQLVACDNNDSDAWFVVESFEVQPFKNAKTGGIKPVGIATVKDYISNRPPFKINSLNTDAPAGDFHFTFGVSFPGIPEEKLRFTSVDLGKTYTFSGRDFEITSLDLDSRRVSITKKDPRVPDNISRIFQF